MSQRTTIRAIRFEDELTVGPSNNKHRDAYGGAVRIAALPAGCDLDAEGVSQLVDALHSALRHSQDAYRARVNAS